MYRKMIIEHEDGKREEYDVFLAFGAKGVFVTYRRDDTIAYMAGDDFSIESRGQVNATPDIIAAIIGTMNNIVSDMLSQLPPDMRAGVLAESLDIARMEGKGINSVEIVDGHARDN